MPRGAENVVRLQTTLGPHNQCVELTELQQSDWNRVEDSFEVILERAPNLKLESTKSEHQNRRYARFGLGILAQRYNQRSFEAKLASNEGL